MDASMPDPATPLRLRRLELSHFKAYSSSEQSPVSFDFGDADIVLIVGSNGRGKTSVIEALELVLAGGYMPRVDLDKEDWEKKKKGRW